jgi:hypothetical protein
MAQSIKVDIRGDAGSLVRALRQSETAMRRLQAATRGLAAQDKLTNTAALALTAALERNAAAMEARTAAANRNTRATRDNANATGDLDDQLGNTNIRLGQANAGFYNVAFAIEDAGQFANGFSAGIRAIGNNLSAMALSLSASGASLADFRTFLAGPGGLIIGLSLFTAAAQLIPPLLDKIGSSSDTAGSALSSFGDGVIDARDNLPLLEEDLEALKSAFDSIIQLRGERVQFAEQDLVQAKARLSQLQDENEFLAQQRDLANLILRTRIEGGTEANRQFAEARVNYEFAEVSEGQRNYLLSLTNDSLEDIIAKSQRQLGLNNSNIASYEEQINKEEAIRVAQNERIRRGDEIVEQTEETADTEEEIAKRVRFQLPLKEQMLQQQAELNRLVKEEADLERIRSRMATQRLLDMTLEPPPQIDSFASAFDRVQERIAFADSTLKQLGVTTDTAKDRFAILADQIENAFDRGLISAQQFREFLAQAEFSVFGNEEFDSEEDRIEAQTQRLRSALEAGMANMAVGILTGEQSVSSAFGSFFAMMGNQLIQLGIANIGLGTAGEALRAFVTNPALAIAAGAALIGIGGQLRKRTKRVQTNITSGRGGSISTGSALVNDPYALSNQRNPFFGGGGASPFNVGYIAPPPPPSNPYAEIRMDAKDFVVSFDDARRELDMVS